MKEIVVHMVKVFKAFVSDKIDVEVIDPRETDECFDEESMLKMHWKIN